jgi:hypothetical protein
VSLCGTARSWSICVPACGSRFMRCSASRGIAVPVSDLFGVAGNQLLDRVPLSPAARTRPINVGEKQEHDQEQPRTP